MPHNVFTLKEVAAYLHITPRDVEQLVRGEEIPFQRVGSRLVFRKNEVAAWASQRILGFGQKELHAFHRSSSKSSQLHPNHQLILPSLIKAEYIEVDLQARTRAAVIRKMVEVGDRTHLVNYPEDLLEGILAREELCSTALRGGFALLHPRHHEPYMFEEPFVALGRTRSPIPFGAPDGGTTDLFFLVCCGADRLHLHTLARLSSMLAQSNLRDELRNASTAGDVLKQLLKAETSLVQAR